MKDIHRHIIIEMNFVITITIRDKDFERTKDKLIVENMNMLQEYLDEYYDDRITKIEEINIKPLPIFDVIYD